MCPIKKTHFFPHNVRLPTFFVFCCSTLLCPFIMWEHNAVYIFIQIIHTLAIVSVFSAVFSKPQDSFNKKDKTFSWSAESAAHHQITLINLAALVLNDMFSCNNVKWAKYRYVHYPWKSVRGTPNILIVLGLFLENESNLEWTMNRAFIVHTDL